MKPERADGGAQAGAAGDVFAGIDGGASRTRVLVAAADGSELARVDGGPGGVDPTEPEAAAAPLVTLLLQALTACDREPPATVLCCGLTGAGREPTRERLARALDRTGVARQVLVVTDAEVALHDALGASAGILLIAGTGSVAWAQDGKGRQARVGGWGPILGDEGSGWALARAALRAVARAHDGRGPATSLTPAILARTGVAVPEDLIMWARAARRADIAALAPTVLDATREDGAAARIVEKAAWRLALHVRTLLERFAPWPVAPVPLALAGGLLERPAALRDALLRVLAQAGTPVRPTGRFVDAARGAASLARTTRLM